MNWEKLSETQQGACRALAEIVADNGASFAIEALADAVENEARAYIDLIPLLVDLAEVVGRHQQQ